MWPVRIIMGVVLEYAVLFARTRFVNSVPDTGSICKSQKTKSVSTFIERASVPFLAKLTFLHLSEQDRGETSRSKHGLFLV